MESDTSWKCPYCGAVQAMTEYVQSYRDRRMSLSPTAMAGLDVSCAACNASVSLSRIVDGPWTFGMVAGALVAMGALAGWAFVAVSLLTSCF